MIHTTAAALQTALKTLKPFITNNCHFFINGLSFGVVTLGETVVSEFAGSIDGDGFTTKLEFERIEKLIKFTPANLSVTLDLKQVDDSQVIEIGTEDFSYQFFTKGALDENVVLDVDGDNFGCDVSAITEGLKEVINGLPESNGNVHLQKVCVRTVDTFLAFQATDGHKAIQHKTAVWPAFNFHKTISASQSKSLLRTLAKLGGDVLVGIGDNYLRISQPGLMLIVKYDEDLNLPGFDNLCREKEDGAIETDVKTLVNVLKQNAKADTSTVQLIASEGVLTVAAKSFVKGHTQAIPSVKLKANVTGNPGVVTFNAQLLAKVLSDLKGNVRLSVRGTIIVINTEKSTRIVCGIITQ